MIRRRHFGAEQKAIILSELNDNTVPICELAEKYHVHINLIHRWKKQFFEGAHSLLASKLERKGNSTSF